MQQHLSKQTLASSSSSRTSGSSSERQSRSVKSSPKPIFRKRFSIFGAKNDSTPPSPSISILSISAPIFDVDFRSPSPSASLYSSTRTSPEIFAAPHEHPTISHSSSCTSLSSACASTSSPVMSVYTPAAAPKQNKIKRKPVPSYIDLDTASTLAIDIAGLDRVEGVLGAEDGQIQRKSSAGTEGLWASGRASYMCRELESPPLEVTIDEDEEGYLEDGLWSSSSDLYSSHRSEKSPSFRHSSRHSSFSSIRISPCLSSAPFRPARNPHRHSHSRTSSISYNSPSGIQIPPSPSPSYRKTSYELPALELPFLPTLFPADGEDYTFIAEPTPLAVDTRNPFDNFSWGSSSTSSYSSSDESGAASPSDLSARAPSTPPTVFSNYRRPSFFRVISGGKSYMLEAGGSPKSTHTFESAREEPEQDVVLEIKLAR